MAPHSIASEQSAQFGPALAEVLRWAQLTPENIVVDPEAAEYGGHEFSLNSRKFCFRTAKSTPLKKGHFVTLWKRSDAGPIRPYQDSDGIDLVLVSLPAQPDGSAGLFCFPAAALREHGIWQTKSSAGKRAFRLYPPNQNELNPQAQRTQRWQSAYHLALSSESTANPTALAELLQD